MQRRAGEIALGFGIAMGQKPDASFFDAMADSQEEAEAAAKRFEADQREQAVVAKFKSRQ